MTLNNYTNMAYVYLHTRLDTNEIFYVGIGKSDTDNFKRSRSIKQRNNYWKNVSNKAGYRVDVVYRNISWEKACEIEIKLIKLYGRSDLGLGNLVNMTDGGEGCLGHLQSDEHKKKLSEAGKGRKHSEETKKKLAETSKGKKLTEETKKKISENSKGRIFSDESKLKISKARKGSKHSDESKLKMSEARKGSKHSEETKKKMSNSAKKRKDNK